MTALPAASRPDPKATLAATSRYLDALDGLREEDLRAPSLLPGWSRGHVVTHLARNADGLRNLLVWARTGVETPMYASREGRNADIEAGAGRPLGVLLTDSREAADRFLAETRLLDDAHWEAPVRIFDRPAFPAREVLPFRRTELEVHHADLGIGYTAADWPRDFTLMLLDRAGEDRSEGPPMTLRATDAERVWQVGSGSGPEVTGTLAALAWWLIGRGDGNGLVSSAGQLPRLTAWR